jgi:polyribonucleotide nucleotidyltransferase
MFNIVKKSIQWGDSVLTIETGRIARQADGAVLVSYGNTSVLCAVVAAKTPKPDVDFFPLTVHYQEKTFAAGKIPGGFFKREGRPTEKEILTSRLIDRPIRPLFPEGFYNDTQIVCTLLSHDLQNDPDILALIGASAALTISGIPFMGPIAAARVGYIDGQYILNPVKSMMPESKLDLVVGATARSVLMVESEAQELPEDVMLGAVMFGQKQMQPVINMIIDLAETCAKDAWAVEQKSDDAFNKRIQSIVEKDLRGAYKLTVKQERSSRLKEISASLKEQLASEGLDEKVIGKAFKKVEQDIVRGDAVKTQKRIDGRGAADIRKIQAEVSVLPQVHGSCLFTRGETQAIVVATLGTGQDEQIIDALDGEYKETFMLHYNFPPYSVGETGRMSGPGRREIGHGKLAWRALRPVLPNKEEFPYTLRCVSEITESNGSSSMATVCGTSLALMDAGVPIKRPVAGIAMGLIKEKDGFIILSDILGDEDHLGDMDFKVAGTDQGITALQMDIKIDGITEEIMKVALEQAHGGRKHILGEMAKAGLDHARESVGATAPRIQTITIPKDKIRDVIGSGGKVIREICEVTGAKIDIDDTGLVKIASTSEESGKAAYDWVYGIVAEPEIGKIYSGKVARNVDFGAFVTFMPGKDGLVHISELADYRVAKTDDVVKEGQEVKVKVLEVDGRTGKVRLSMRVVDQATGEDISDKVKQKSGKDKENKESAA